MVSSYPVSFDVDFPARPLGRLSTAFRFIAAIPIVVVLTMLSGSTFGDNNRDAEHTLVIGGAAVFVPLVLMLVFRQKYPRWWFDWNLNLLRFSNRVTAYLALLDDRYPSTDEEQSVHLDFMYPDARQLNRWLPLVKWVLAIPHYFVLFFLGLGRSGWGCPGVVRDPVHGFVSAGALRLRGRRAAVDEPRQRLRVQPGHGPVPAVQAELMAIAMPVAAVRSSMKAVLVEKPVSIGSLKLVETMVPAVPDDGVLVRVVASSANPVDLFPTSWAGYLMGGRKPVVIGTDFAGVVEGVGKDVSGFRAGDEVFGGARGAFAEHMVVRESRAIAHKPASISFEQAGTVAVAATTALQALRDHGGLSSGQSVLINGASGGVGTFAVQIARGLEASVTAVCSTRNVEMVRSLGASTVIDYTREDFTRGASKYDLVIDVAGSHSFSACKRVLKPHGTFVGVGAAGVQHGRGGGMRAIGHFFGTRVTSIGGSRKVVTLFIANLTAEDMKFLASLLADGRVTPVIDRRYSLDEVSEALQYLNEGHARAKVAISV